jgi:hypothetical protein
MTLRPSRLAATFAFSVAFACAGGWSISAHAAETAAEGGDVEQARRHFGQGSKLYKEGDFDAALVQFERAYSIKANYRVLYNIAQCYFELRQYVEARDALARYLKDGGGNIDAERKTAVENDLSELQRRIAHLTLNVNVSGATVYVDGKRMGTTPLATALDVNEGQRTISIEAPDRGSKQRVVRVAGGEQQVIDVEFEAASAAAAPGAPRAELRPRREATLGAGFWVSGVSALVLGAGAGVTGYLAISAQADRDDDLKRPGVTRSELDDTRRRARTFALSSDILAGGALVCAGVASVLFFTRDSGQKQVGLGVGPGNVELYGRF